MPAQASGLYRFIVGGTYRAAGGQEATPVYFEFEVNPSTSYMARGFTPDAGASIAVGVREGESCLILSMLYSHEGKDAIHCKGYTFPLGSHLSPVRWQARNGAIFELAARTVKI